jgi:hypothetical protein
MPNDIEILSDIAINGRRMTPEGIAPAATRNVAGGGGTDFFRAMQAGSATAEQSAGKKTERV